MQTQSFSLDLAGKTLTAEFSDLTAQANGSVLLKYGETAILVTAVMGEKEVPMNYFPLSVEFEEKFYAAGAILYELLAGRPPFDGKMPSLVLADVLTRPPEPLGKYAVDLPVGIEELVKKTLAKDPQDRPPSARALRNALSAYLRPSSAPSPGPTARQGTVPPLPLVSKSKKPTLELVRDSSVPPPPFPSGTDRGGNPSPPRPGKPKSPGVKLSPSSKKRPPPPPRKRKP